MMVRKWNLVVAPFHIFQFFDYDLYKKILEADKKHKEKDLYPEYVFLLRYLLIQV